MITVIGILAAISVPSLPRGPGRRAAGSHPVGPAGRRTALVEYSIDNNGRFPSATGFNPTSAATDLTGYGWSQSAETTGFHYATNAGATAWCLDMTNSTGAVFHITTNSPSGANATTATGLCSAIASSTY